MTMMQQDRQVRYIGLDVHKASISVAIAEASGAPGSYGHIANDPSAIRKLMTRLGGPGIQLRVAYEAGPTGYGVHRQLTSMGIECLVVAPSLIPKRPGDKVKTDRRDALKLARLLRSGDLTPVWVPDEAHEALRNLVRARAGRQSRPAARQTSAEQVSAAPGLPPASGNQELVATPFPVAAPTPLRARPRSGRLR